MKKPRDLLREIGFEERIIEGQILFVKGHVALVYMFNSWIPCHYSYGTILVDKLYINTMEELSALNNI
jgi:hypothetical protein